MCVPIALVVDLKLDTYEVVHSYAKIIEKCKDNKEVHFLKNMVFRKCTSLLCLLNLSVCIESATCANILSCKLGKNPD